MHILTFEASSPTFITSMVALGEMHVSTKDKAPDKYAVYATHRVFETERITTSPDTLIFTDSTGEPILVLWEKITKVQAKWEEN